MGLAAAAAAVAGLAELAAGRRAEAELLLSYTLTLVSVASVLLGSASMLSALLGWG